MTLRGRQGLASACQPLGTPIPIGQDEDEVRALAAVAGRWPCRKVSRSRYMSADGSQAALLDLEHQLAAGRPVRAGGDDQEVRGVGEPAGDPLPRQRGRGVPSATRSGHRGSIEGTA